MNDPRPDCFVQAVQAAIQGLAGRQYAFSGDTARCLWMLHGIPGGSPELWKRVCHPWPTSLEVVADGDLPPGLVQSQDAVALEFAAAMLSRRVSVALPGLPGPVPLVPPDFVLAQLLVDPEPLAVTRVADLLRCLKVGRDVELEDVRALLKAVRAGDRYETLLAIDYVV